MSALPNGLRDINRFITTHNADGKAIYSSDVPETSKWVENGTNMNFFLGYTTQEFPVSLNPSDFGDEMSTPKDIVSYSKELGNPPGLAKSTGKQLPSSLPHT
ncbi:hypothetical protein GLAREA_11040 [Glarea lozoyensis ATCC 20868]|uniref:Uncharacterized protein n=1 Tax=Glarea lozoyensis (strain ATCC 20868 / MF5171) TaxID=1116229 RepID=S3DTT4_GLAL2|nr:uncharacterized protein GLAREA_11040 [Glarea lozoyensis ATCC 20868]EPE35341.1 hypothetical protein GLAREA_11040 [Glarea lozoyensis ATCC 20868]